MGVTTERVTYRDDQTGRRTTLFLEVTSESALLLCGRQVDKEGCPTSPTKAYLKAHNAEGGEVRHIIEKTLVETRQRMVMDYTYGWLVPDGTATQQQQEARA